jgi:hypothetical protein
LAQQIQFRRGTAAEWTAANPILALGEPGLETDTHKVKFGDGVTHWVSLDYGAWTDLNVVGATGEVVVKASNLDNDFEALPFEIRHSFVVGDWSGPSGGYYTLTITHGETIANPTVEVWVGNTVVETEYYSNDSYSVVLRVPAVPDLRFAGIARILRH